MISDDSQAQRFLTELQLRTKGDPNAKVSMYDVGAAMGLEKNAAGKLAEEIIGRGWAEIKTLSGAIGITAEGLEAAGKAGRTAQAAQQLAIGRGPLLDAASRRSVDKALASIKACITGLSAAYEQIEELVIDLKTAEVQLLSPRPKTAILRETLRSLSGTLSQVGAEETAAMIDQIIR